MSYLGKRVRKENESHISKKHKIQYLSKEYEPPVPPLILQDNCVEPFSNNFNKRSLRTIIETLEYLNLG